MSKIIMFFIYGWHETENINEDIAMTTLQIKKHEDKISFDKCSALWQG